MTNRRININLTPEPYKTRRTNVFRWTILLYLFIAIVIGLSTDIKSFLIAFSFLTIIFILDFNRRLKWVQYSLRSLVTNDSSIDISYYDKTEIKTVNISWDRLNISKGSTYTRNSTTYISIKNGDDNVATFYADEKYDNKKFDDLFKDLKTLKTANA